MLAGPASAKGPLVLSAASLQDVMTEAANAWAARGNERPVLSFAGTPALARQAAAGAPADLIVTADRSWMDWLIDRGAVRPASVANLAGGRLVVVAGADRPWIGSAAELRRALGAGPLALADTDSVPAGRYARTALIRLGMWDEVEARLAVAENVRAALAFVERGAAPLGIVYETDARASPDVRVVGRFSRRAHAPIVYPAALLASSDHPEAEAFLSFLQGPEGRAIFRRAGFGAP